MMHNSKQPFALLVLLSILCEAEFVNSGLAAAEREPAASPGWEEFVRPVLEGEGQGVAWFPTADGGDSAEILDPRGYTVHATDPDDPGEELVRPAGEPFRFPSGRWRVWMQGEWSMSPSSILMGVSVASLRGRVGTHMERVAPAGRIGIAGDEAAAAGHELWLLYADPPPGEATGYELSRRRPLAEARDGVLMPAGRVLAGLRRRDGEGFAALSRPFRVEAGQTLPAPLERPSPDRAWLVASVGGGHFLEPASLLTLAVSGEEKPRPPDFELTTREGVHAVWYDLEPRTVILAGGDAEVYLEPQTLELAGGQIASFEGDLEQRPLLDVGLVLPRLLRARPFELAVRKLPEGSELTRVEKARTAGRHRFQGSLVQGLLEVVLETHVGTFRQQVDLTGREEGSVTLEPEVIELWGTVRYGQDPHAATIELVSVAGEKIEAAADEAGEYRAQALQPLRMVTVRLAGVEREPWMDFLLPPIDRSQPLDFDLPDADVTVRVVDAETREGIPNARVGVRNEYLPPREDGEEASGALLDESEWRRRHRAVAQSLTADPSGVARLPPPRPGRIEVGARAEGYRSLERPLRVEVPDPPQDQEIEILLEPFGETVEVHVRLPDGTPAAGAEVLRLAGADSASVFSGRADAAGVVQVPVAPAEGLLLLKHPAAAFGVVEWPEWVGLERVEWVFAPAAELPLKVRVTDPSGEVPVQAALALWLHGHRLSERVQWWLFRLPAMTDRNGLWIARGLPRETLRVLAWSPPLGEQVRSGALDTLATEVRYPWPATVELRVVQ